MRINKRKKLNLNVMNGFQKWLYYRILATIAISSTIGAIILYIYARYEMGSSFYDASIKIIRVSDLLFPVAVAGALVSLISGALIALFLPQKIAGPLYRFEKTLKAVQDGDLTVAITLRSNDILRDFEATVNNMIKSLRLKALKVKEAHEQTERALAEKEQRPELAELLDREKKTLDGFKT